MRTWCQCKGISYTWLHHYPEWPSWQYTDTTGWLSSSSLPCCKQNILFINDFITDHSLIILARVSMTFSSFAAALFSPQDVHVNPHIHFQYSKFLGQSGNINLTSAFIQALLLSSTYRIYGVHLYYIGFNFLNLILIYYMLALQNKVGLLPLTNQSWTIGPIEYIDTSGLPGLNPSSTLNFTIWEWYGIHSNPGCEYSQVLNTSLSGFNVSVTFADCYGKCIFQPSAFLVLYPFWFVLMAFGCGESNMTLAQGNSLIFIRATPSQLAENDTTAVVIIYCQPKVAVMSVDATMDLSSNKLLSINNIWPLSSDQQQLYDPTNFTDFLTNCPWNGFSIAPSIDPNVPLQLINQLNTWINLTISVDVGGQWLNQSTVLINGIVQDVPGACMSLCILFHLLAKFWYILLTQTAKGWKCIIWIPWPTSIRHTYP